MTKSIFMQRALRRAGEHLQSDRSGFSLLGYACKWLFARLKHLLAVRLTGRAPDNIQVGPDQALVAVKITGGLGDYVVFARVLRDLALLSDALRFHVFCSSSSGGDWVFGGLPCVDAVYDEVFYAAVQCRYDCTMQLNQFVVIDDNLNLGKLTTLAEPFVRVFAHCRKHRKPWDLFIERQPTLNGAFAHHAVTLGDNRYSFIHSQLGITPGSMRLDLPCDDSIAADLAGRFGAWLTINNGFDANYVMTARQATKCYPTGLWRQVVAGLKQRRPDVGIVQIGGKTSVPIEAVDVNLINQTSLAQAAGVLRGALLHLDIEGGLVHVAAALGIRSVVLFGPTSLNYFGYPENVNLSSGFCGNCWGVTERWMETCPRGYAGPKCLEELEPAHVIEAVLAALDRDHREAPSSATMTLPLLYNR